MNRWQVAALVAVVAVLGGGTWWLLSRSRNSGAHNAHAMHLAASWRGKYRGTMELPATLNWCPGTRRGILEAISGDSGIAVVLYERDSLTSGPHLLVSPDLGAAIPKPGATMVMRWMRTDRDTAVTGFRSQAGTVRITLIRNRASGDINARMGAPASGLDTLVIQGVFRDVPVVTTAAACS